MRRLAPVTVGLILLLGLPALAAGNPTGLAFLKIGVGADAIGMADAVVSNVDGPAATYWNPAALGWTDGLEATVVHNESFESIRHEFAGVVRDVGPVGVGLSFHGSYTDNMDAYDEAANYLGTFGYYSMAVAATGGYSFNDMWAAGASIKYLREEIDIWNATGAAFDFGIQGRSVLSNLDVGFAVLNLGSSMTFIDVAFDLPMTIQGGATYHVPMASMRSEGLLAIEVRKIRDEDTSVHFGLEYRLQETALMRIGYRNGIDTEDLSFGIGFNQGSIQADYAYVPFGEDLGSQHRVGLTYRR